MKSRLNDKQTKIIFFLGAVLFLFLSFNFNLFHSVNHTKFYTFQSDSEALVIGRLVKSHNNGVLSSQGRMGRYYELEGDMNANQTKLLLGVKQGGVYGEYNSQLGLQGIIFSTLDIFLLDLNIQPKNRIKLYHGLMSLFLSLILCIVIYILYQHIGFEASLVIFLSILLSKWPVYMAKNIYWMLAFMFLPFFITILSCAIEERGRKVYFFVVSLLVMLSVFLKSLMGYEYISTILIASVTPIVYFAVKNNWPRKIFISRFILVSIFSLAGFILAVVAHIYQLELSSGNLTEAIDLIKERVLVRTQTSPEIYLNTPYYDSQQASVFYVLYVFLIKGGSFRLKIPYLFWILIFAYISIQVYKPKIASYYKDHNLRLLKALVITTWFSFLAPLSWFVLAKSHSYIHNINYIVWHIPFMIFGFALVGYYWKLKIREFINKYRMKFNL